MALKDHMQDRIATLLDRVAELEKQNAELSGELEMYYGALQDDQAMEREIATLHEFIEDVQRGIRDLSEYEEVCRRAGLAA